MTNSVRPGFVLGYVAALGAPLEAATREVERMLENDFSYGSEIIRLSTSLRNAESIGPRVPDIVAKFTDGERIWNAMNAGKARCEQAPANAARVALAGLADLWSKGPLKEQFTYQVRSFKRPQEVAMFRKALGNRFFLVALHASRGRRVTNLERELARNLKEAGKGGEQGRAAAELLIARDDREEGDAGQNVRGTFEGADAFITCRNPEEMRRQLARLLRVIFSHPFETPTADEVGMMTAATAALRSAALGRQVGAAIVNGRGSTVASGYNEVPAAGGGHSGQHGGPDLREFQQGNNESSTRNNELIGRVVSIVRDVVSNAATTSPPPSAQMPIPWEDVRHRLEKAGLAGLIEFGRDVHAEQSAICAAAAEGRRVINATMYVTTFPCHLCAKHIVASGISRIVFIEPYAKSLSRELLRDIVSIDESRKGRVPIESFIGIAPKMYMNLFRMPKRELGDGAVVQWHTRDAEPWFVRGPFYPTPAEIAARMSDVITSDADDLTRQSSQDGKRQPTNPPPARGPAGPSVASTKPASSEGSRGFEVLDGAALKANGGG